MTRLVAEISSVGDRFREAEFRTTPIGNAHCQPLISTAEHPSFAAYPLLHDLDFWRGDRERFLDLLLQFVQGEMARAPHPMPRIAGA